MVDIIYHVLPCRSINVKRGPAETAKPLFDSIHKVTHFSRMGQYCGLRAGPHELTHPRGKLLGFLARDPARLSDLVAQSGHEKGQLGGLIGKLTW